MYDETSKNGKIFKGQKWVELYGNFTISDLEDILTKLKEANINN